MKDIQHNQNGIYDELLLKVLVSVSIRLLELCSTSFKQWTKIYMEKASLHPQLWKLTLLLPWGKYYRYYVTSAQVHITGIIPVIHAQANNRTHQNTNTKAKKKKKKRDQTRTNTCNSTKLRTTAFYTCF